MGELTPTDAIAIAGGNRNNDGWGDGNGWWIILLFMIFGWGGNRGWNNQGGGAGGDALYPWLNQAQLTTQGFADQNTVMALNGLQTSVTAGFANAATQLCQCCGDMQMALANGFFGVEAGANARQIANMQQQFGTQTAMMQGFNAQQAQTSQLAADLGLGMANQTATILAEHCADRAALSDGVRDIIAAQVANTQRQIDNQNMWGQRLADQLCQYRLEDKDETIAQLRQQISMKDLAASQAQQNAFIQQGFANEVDALYNRLNTCPVPTTPVYGRTPIYTCNNGGCPCNG